MVKIFEKFRFWSNFRKILILVKFSKNLDFGQNFLRVFQFMVRIIFGKFRFRSKFSNNFRNFVRKFLAKIFDFGKIFEIFRFLVKFFENFRFCSNFPKIYVFGQIIGKFLFWWRFSKISELFENYKKFRFWSSFRNISILFKILVKFSIKCRF